MSFFRFKQSVQFTLLLLLSLNETYASYKIPEGFAELAKEQTLWLGVSVEGDDLGSFKGEVYLGHLKFLEPRELIEAIANKYGISSYQAQLIRERVHSELAISENLSCATNFVSSDCETTKNDGVSVFYDSRKSTVFIVFPGSNSKSSTVQTYYTAEPDSTNALIHQQTLNFSRSDNSASYSLNSTETIGLNGSGYLYSDWNYNLRKHRDTSISSLNLNNLFVRNDFAKKNYMQVGVMDSSGIYSNSNGNFYINQLPLMRIQGLRIGSTQSWVNQERVSLGSPVSVLLTNDSRVDVFKGSQLLGSYNLKSGFQTLDTRAFPRGNYQLRMEIFENNILVRTENTHFIGGEDFANTNTQWFTQLGKTFESSWSDREILVAHAGVRTPLSNTLSITNSLVFSSIHKLIESGFNWNANLEDTFIGGKLSFSSSLLNGNRSLHGNTQQLGYYNGLSLNFYRQSMSTPECELLGYFSGCYTNLNASLSVPVNEWNASIDFTESSSKNTTRYHSNDLHFNDFERSSQNLTSNSGVFGFSSKSKSLQLSISRMFNLSGGVNMLSSFSIFNRKSSYDQFNENGGVLSFNFTMSNINETRNNLFTFNSRFQRSNVSGDYTDYSSSYTHSFDKESNDQVGINLSGLNTQSLNASLFNRFENVYGAGSFTLNKFRDNKNGFSNSNLNGTYSSSVVVDKNGISLGRWGGAGPSSAIIIDVDSSDYKSIGGYAYLDTGGKVKLGEKKKSIMVTPGYQQSELRFSDYSPANESVSTDFKSGTESRKLFMLPGKVYSRKISIETYYIWFGVFMDKNNQTLDDIKILNSNNQSNYGNGAFMWESKKLLTSVKILTKGVIKNCKIEKSESRLSINNVGKLLCK